MVTASHLPMPTHNGFKMCRGTLPLAGEEIQELKDVFLAGISKMALVKQSTILTRMHTRSNSSFDW